MPDINVVSPELQSRIKIWRSKMDDGTITLEEMKQVVIHLRQDRRSAAAASESSGKSTRKKAPARSAEDMLSELGSP